MCMFLHGTDTQYDVRIGMTVGLVHATITPASRNSFRRLMEFGKL